MDAMEKLVELIESARYWGSNTSEEIADNLLDSGVTVQELDGCAYCKEDREGYRKMIGAFSYGWRCQPDRDDYSDFEKCKEGRKRWLQQPAEGE